MKPAERYDAELPAVRRRKAGLAPFILAAGAAMVWSMASAQDTVTAADAAEAAAEAAEAAADAAETAAESARTAAESARTAAEAARSAQGASEDGQNEAEAEGGWFTAEQVASGAAQYNQSCAGCHGSEVAESFSNWGGTAQSMMDSFIALGMPADNPGGLSPQQYIDISGYIMNLGGLPLGHEVIAGTEDTELARFP